MNGVREGKGVLVYLQEGTAGVPASQLSGERSASAEARVQTWLDIGLGAQILRDLGVGKMKLLSSPRRMPSMTGFDLEVTGHIATPADLERL